MQQWQKVLLKTDSTIQDVIQNLIESTLKIVLVINEFEKLEGTISDGDIRRGLLKGLNLNSPITSIIRRNPLVVTPELSRELVLNLMHLNKIHQIPIVDENNKVVGLNLWDELNTKANRSNIMVIMAGGKGTRLMPYTQNCPKPMIKVAGKPIMEHLIHRAKLEGFNHFVIAIHHFGNVIEEYFGDGKRLDVKIEYLRELTPLGTAGALRLLNPRPDMPFIVTNADVMTDVHYAQLLDFHNLYEATATMAVRIHELQNSFGIVKTKGIDIIGLEEKPVSRNYINAGVYALSPDSLDEIEINTIFDMTTLFECLMKKDKRTIAFPMHETWIDVGRPDDLDLFSKSLNNKF